MGLVGTEDVTNIISPHSMGTFGGVMVKKLTWLANLHEWVRVSLGAPFIRPCASSKQRAS